MNNSIIISITSAVIGGVFVLLGAIAGGLITYFCSIQLQNRNRFCDAKEKFRNAIHSAVIGFLERPDGRFTLDDIAGIKTNADQIDLACRNLSPFLSKRKRIALDQTIQAYRKACQEDTPQRQRNWTEYIIQCAMHNTKEITPTQILKTHVDMLLSFVDKP